MKKWLAMATVLVLAGVSTQLRAKVAPASIFCDHMVLQREMAVPVWGTADAGEAVTVAFAGQTLQTKAGQDGKWMVKLSPLATNAKPQELKINDVTIQDVLVGEVWLCSGQSNMEMPLWGASERFRNYDGDKIAEEIGNKPLIRLTRMVPYGWSKLPKADFQMTWTAMTPETAKPMSAVAFFFGQRLFEKLQIPIGLVTSHWGGTRIEPWTPPCGFDTVPELASIARSVNAKLPGHPVYNELNAKLIADYQAWLDGVRASVAAKGEVAPPPAFPAELVPWSQHQQPTVLYNHMLYPFVPFAFRGAIWYQGCSNRGEDMLYKYKMQALFNGWKQVFQNPELKFYFVQLAPFRYSGDVEALPRIWEAQEAFSKENEPQAGMVVINDHGDFGDIHPHDKKPVGERMANMTLQRDYGFKDLKPDFPICVSHAVSGNSYILKFKHVTSWKTMDNAPIQDFQIAGLDGVFKPATVKVDGTDLIVSSEEVAKPKAIRYLWHQTIAGKLFNEEGLPLGGFRFSEPITADTILEELGADWKEVYQFNLFKGCDKGEKANYTVDKSASITGKIKKIAYLVTSTKLTGENQWLCVTMDAFTKDATKIGVPTISADATFQQKISNLNVISNVAGIKNGFHNEGNIEFWSDNYGTENGLKLPGADSRKYDFDDIRSNPKKGYGCMQVHLYQQRQTLFAYNCFGAGTTADFGIGNGKGQHKDYTFDRNLSKEYKAANIAVYVLTE